MVVIFASVAKKKHYGIIATEVKVVRAVRWFVRLRTSLAVHNETGEINGRNVSMLMFGNVCGQCVCRRVNG